MGSVCSNVDNQSCLLFIPVNIAIDLIKILEKTVNSNHHIFDFITLKKLLQHTLSAVDRVCEWLCDYQVRSDFFIWFCQFWKYVIIALFKNGEVKDYVPLKQWFIIFLDKWQLLVRCVYRGFYWLLLSCQVTVFRYVRTEHKFRTRRLIVSCFYSLGTVVNDQCWLLIEVALNLLALC